MESCLLRAPVNGDVDFTPERVNILEQKVHLAKKENPESREAKEEDKGFCHRGKNLVKTLEAWCA